MLFPVYAELFHERSSLEDFVFSLYAIRILFALSFYHTVSGKEYKL